MSDTMASLQRTLASAGDLQSVVRTMKAVTAASIGQYERSVAALSDYYRTIELGLGVCLRDSPPHTLSRGVARQGQSSLGAVVFGSDQGLVGRFNEVIAEHALTSFADHAGNLHIWAVGERIEGLLRDAGLAIRTVFPVPITIDGITPLLGKILVEHQALTGDDAASDFLIFHNQPLANGGYTPVRQRLLPLDDEWQQELAGRPWPSGNLPQIIDGNAIALRALIRDYLFVSLFRACAESLASENASRLVAMLRADHNIDDLLTDLRGTYRQLRQAGIDEELFDVVAGYEALLNPT